MKHISIVLARTSHPGNIGAAARAMKNMGLADLRLVAPAHFPDATATARASGADDLLEGARVFDDLAAAIEDCHLVLGTSARLRSIAWEVCDARTAAARVAAQHDGERAAVVFGNEQAGLTNAELDLCQALLHIPTNEDYSSLNLGMAVQVVAYELRMAHLGDLAITQDSEEARAATSGELEAMYEHMRDVMTRQRFLNPQNPRHLMRRMRRLFNRAAPDENEVQIMRGWMSAMERGLDDSAD